MSKLFYFIIISIKFKLKELSVIYRQKYGRVNGLPARRGRCVVMQFSYFEMI